MSLGAPAVSDVILRITSHLAEASTSRCARCRLRGAGPPHRRNRLAAECGRGRLRPTSSALRPERARAVPAVRRTVAPRQFRARRVPPPARFLPGGSGRAVGPPGARADARVRLAGDLKAIRVALIRLRPIRHARCPGGRHRRARDRWVRHPVRHPQASQRRSGAHPRLRTAPSAGSVLLRAHGRGGGRARVRRQRRWSALPVTTRGR